jgi:hypothetical protein
MPVDDTARLRRNLATGGVTRPPALHSILRLQTMVGNRAAQRILGIGDGRMQPSPAETAAAEPPVSGAPFPWAFSIAIGVLAGLLATAIAMAGVMEPKLIAAVGTGSSLAAGLLSGILKKGGGRHADSQADTGGE